MHSRICKIHVIYNDFPDLNFFIIPHVMIRLKFDSLIIFVPSYTLIEPMLNQNGA